MNIDSNSIIRVRPETRFIAPREAPPERYTSHFFTFKQILEGLEDTSTLTDDLKVLDPPFRIFVKLYCRVKRKQIFGAYDSILIKCERRLSDLFEIINDIACAHFFYPIQSEVWHRVDNEISIISLVVEECPKNRAILLPSKLNSKIAALTRQYNLIKILARCASQFHQVIQMRKIALSFFTKKFSEQEKIEWTYFSKNYEKQLSEIRALSNHLLVDKVRSTLKTCVEDLERLENVFTLFNKMKAIVSKRPCKLLTKRKFQVIVKSIDPFRGELSIVDFSLKIRETVNQVLKTKSFSSAHVLDNVKMWGFKYYAGKIRELSLIFIGRKIAKGSFKRIFDALYINFKRSGESNAPFIAHGHSCVFAEVVAPGYVEKVYKSLQLLDKIINSVPDAKRNLFIPLPSCYHYERFTHLQYVQTWFHGNLKWASKSKMVPLDCHAQYFYPIKLKDILSMFLDACDALNETHELGIVHRDIKMDNLLIRKKDPWGSVLNDWDLAEEEGYYPVFPYEYWGSCANEGFCSFECDGYSVLIALGKAFFLKDFYTFSEKRSLMLSQYFDMMLMKFLNNHIKAFFISQEMEAGQKESFLTTLGQSNIKEMIDILERLEMRDLIQEIKIFQEIHSLIRFGIEVDLWLVEEMKCDSVFQKRMNMSFISERNAIVKAFFRELRPKILKKWGINPLDVSAIHEKIQALYTQLV